MKPSKFVNVVCVLSSEENWLLRIFYSQYTVASPFPGHVHALPVHLRFPITPNREKLQRGLENVQLEVYSWFPSYWEFAIMTQVVGSG